MTDSATWNAFLKISEAFSDLNKKAQHDLSAMLKTQATFLTPLVQAILHSSVSIICFVPFPFFNTAHWKFELWSEISLHTHKVSLISLLPYSLSPSLGLFKYIRVNLVSRNTLILQFDFLKPRVPIPQIPLLGSNSGKITFFPSI